MDPRLREDGGTKAEKVWGWVRAFAGMTAWVATEWVVKGWMARNVENGFQLSLE